jgi:hypothetical protein
MKNTERILEAVGKLVANTSKSKSKRSSSIWVVSSIPVLRGINTGIVGWSRK